MVASGQRQPSSTNVQAAIEITRKRPVMAVIGHPPGPVSLTDENGLTWCFDAWVEEKIEILDHQIRIEVELGFETSIAGFGSIERSFPIAYIVPFSACIAGDPLLANPSRLLTEVGLLEYLDETLHAVRICLWFRMIYGRNPQSEILSRFRRQAAKAVDRGSWERKTMATMIADLEQGRGGITAQSAESSQAQPIPTTELMHHGP